MWRKVSKRRRNTICPVAVTVQKTSQSNCIVFLKNKKDLQKNETAYAEHQRFFGPIVNEITVLQNAPVPSSKVATEYA